MQRRYVETSDGKKYPIGVHVPPVYDFVFQLVLLGLARKLRYDVVQALKKEPPPQHVLDIGSGTGEVAFEIVKHFPEVSVSAVDILEDMLAIARKKAKRLGCTIDFVNADMNALPFHDGMFEAVTCSFALHEVPAEYRITTLREVHRVLTLGGRFVVMDMGTSTNIIHRLLLRLFMTIFEEPQAKDFVTQDVRGLLEKKWISHYRRETVPFWSNSYVHV